MCGKDDIKYAADDNRLPSGHAEKDVSNLHCREGDHTHNEAVEEETEVDGTETTHHRCGLS